MTSDGAVSPSLRAALDYAQRGWPVFPCHGVRDGRCTCGKADCKSPGKHPRVEHGLKAATTDPAIIRSWGAKWPAANVTIPTGAESGIVVLDVDIDHGGQESLADLEAKHGQLPPTPESLTGGGGVHYLFQHPGVTIRNSTGKLGPGLDVRGDGGYIIAPPSQHVSGGTYEWDAARSPDTLPLAPMPSWLLDLVTDKAGGDGHHQAEPIGEIITEGQRNATLASLAGSMRRRGASEAAILAALEAENAAKCPVPLEHDELVRIAASVACYAPANIAVTLPASESSTGSVQSAPEDASALLDEVYAYLRRYVAMTDEQTDACVLWAAHTHAFSAAETTPYLHITSAEKQSGKSRLLETLELVVARPWHTSRASVAALVRKVSDGITLLLDETDRSFEREKEYAAALLQILNAGYRTGAKATLCMGNKNEVVDLPVFCAKAIAGLGSLPDTVEDRSILIAMKRAGPGEKVAKLRNRQGKAEGWPVRDRLAAWAAAHLAELEEARPDLPEVLSARQEDCWEPLMAIADLVGGDWPQRARRAAVVLAERQEEQSQGAQLLDNIRTIFGEHGDPERLVTSTLLADLNEREDWPWGTIDHHEKPLTTHKLAAMLKRFTVGPDKWRKGQGTERGYHRADFLDPWARYLPAYTPQESATSATSATEGQSELSLGSPGVADVADVALVQGGKGDGNEEAATWTL